MLNAVLARHNSPIVDLIITGPTSVGFGSDAQYTCTAVLANKIHVDVTPTWGVNTSLADVVADSLGTVSVPIPTGVSSAALSVTANIVDPATNSVFAKAKSVNAYNGVKKIDITGPSYLSDNTNDNQFVATVTFTDGSTSVVTNSTTWSIVTSTASGTTIDSTGKVDVPNIGAAGAVTIKASYTDNGIQVQNTYTINIGNDYYVTGINIIGDSTFSDYTTTSFTLQFVYSDASVVDVANSAVTWSLTGTIPTGTTLNQSGSLFVPDLPSNANFNLHVSYPGQSPAVTADLPISVSNTRMAIALNLYGATSMSDHTLTYDIFDYLYSGYTANAVYTDGTEIQVTSDVTWSLETPITGVSIVRNPESAPASQNVAHLYTQDLDGDKVATIVGTYHTVEGTTLTGKLDVTINDVYGTPSALIIRWLHPSTGRPTTLWPIQMANGEVGVSDGYFITLCGVITKTGSTTEFTISGLTWSILSGPSDAYFSGDTLYTGDVSGTKNQKITNGLTVRGTYTDGGGNSVTTDLSFNLYNRYYVNTLTLFGEASVGDNNTYQYTATVKYADGKTVKDVSPVWSIYGTAPTNVSIDSSTGILTIGNINGVSTAVTINASYTENGVTAVGSLYIKINNTAYLTSLDCDLPTDLYDNSQYELTFTATYSDGATATVTPYSMYGSAIQNLTLNSVGVITIGDILPASNNATYSLFAYYKEEAITKGINKIAHLRNVWTPTIQLDGPTYLNDKGQYTYQLMIDMADGNGYVALANNDSARYSIIAPAYGCTIDPITGVLTVPDELADASITVRGRWIYNNTSVYATIGANINSLNYVPVSVEIIGPSSILDGPTSVKTYSLAVTYSDGYRKNIVAVNNDNIHINWSVNDNGHGITLRDTMTNYGYTKDSYNYQAWPIIPTDCSGSNDSNPSIDINVSYTEGAITVTGSKNVTITNYYSCTGIIDIVTFRNGSPAGLTPTFIDHATGQVWATGYPTCQLGVKLKYSYTPVPKTYAYGNEVQWAVLDGPAGTTIDSDGYLYVPDIVGTQYATVQATYTTDKGETFTFSKKLTLSDYYRVTGLAIPDVPTSIGDLSVTDLYATVTYNDGHTEYMNPTAWVITSNTIGSGVYIDNNQLHVPDVGLTGGTIKIRADLTLGTSTFHSTVKTITVSDTFYVDHINIIGPTSAYSSSSNTYAFNVVYTDGSSTVVTPTVTMTNATAGITRSGNVVNIPNINSGSFTLNATYTAGGHTATGSLTVNVQPAIQPVNLTINGISSLGDNTTSTYTATVSRTLNGAAYNTGTVLPVWSLTNNSGGCSISTGGVLTIPDILPSNTSVTVNASYTENGITVTASKNVSLADTYKVTGLSINGSSSVSDKSSVSYTATATISDGTTIDVTPSWTLSSNTAGASVDPSGTVSVPDVGLAKQFYINASYTRSGVTVTANKLVVVNDIFHINAIYIAGASSVNDKGTSQFVAHATYSDTSDAILSSGVTWSLTNNSVGASINSSGVLTIPDVGIAGSSVTVNISYVDIAGTTFTATLPVTITDTFKPQSIAINGLATATYTSTLNYTATVTNTDNSTTTVTPTWSINGTGNTAGASIDSSGHVTVNTGLLVDSQFTIDCTYTDKGTTVTSSKLVNVKFVNNLEYITIAGSANINDHSSTTYTCTSTKTDGTVTSITPTWTLTNNTANASINSSGVLTIPDITSAGSVTVNASYTLASITKTDFIIISVTNFYKPSSLVINGVSTSSDNSASTFTATVTYTDGTTANVTPTWSLSSNAVNAVLSGTSTATVTIPDVSTPGSVSVNASYVENGVTVTATKMLAATNDFYIDSISITGNNSLYENSTGSYAATVHYSNGSTKSIIPTVDLTNNASGATLNSILASAVFNGTSNYASTNASFSLTGQFTIEAWINIPDNSLSLPIWHLGSAVTHSQVYGFGIYPNTGSDGSISTYGLAFISRNHTFTNTAAFYTGVLPSINTWHHVAVTRDASNVWRFFLDGVVQTFSTRVETWLSGLYAQLTTTNFAIPATNMNIGGPLDGYFKGKLFNFRVSNTCRYNSAFTPTFDYIAPDANTMLLAFNGVSSISDLSSYHWTLTNHSITFDSTNSIIVNVPELTYDDYITLNASHTEAGVTLTGSKNISVLNNIPVSLTINGNASVNDKTSNSTYTATATYLDGSTSTKTVGWVLTNNNSGCTISSGGVLTVPDLAAGGGSVTITASYSEEGATVNASKTITLVDNFKPSSLAITGSASPVDETTTTYTATVTYTDATTASATGVVWSLTNNSSGCSIDSSTGVLTIPRLLVDGSVTVNATYTENGTSVTQTKAVSIATRTKLTGLVVNGNSSIGDHTTATYTYSPTFSEASYTGSFNGSGYIDSGASFSLTGQFTIEAWIYLTDTSGALPIWHRGSASSYTQVYGFGIYPNIGSSGSISTYGLAFISRVHGWTTSAAFYTGIVPSLNTWHHVAVTRDASNVWRFFLDGVLQTHTTRQESFQGSYIQLATTDFAIPATGMNIGGPLDGYFKGQMFDIRVSNTCRYNSNFTTFFGPYSSDSNTQLLTLACESTLIDRSSNSSTLTAAGSFSIIGSAYPTITPTWSLTNNSDGCSVNSSTGVLTVPDLAAGGGSVTVNVSATYLGDTVTNALTVGINDTFKPSSLTINGVSSGVEGTTKSYTATVTYTDATTASPTVTWSLTNNSVGASINSSGVLTLPSVNANTNITINASYTENGTTVTATKTFTIINYVPTSIVINGVSSVNDVSTSSAFTVDATYSDGTTSTNVSGVTYSLTNNTGGCTVNSSTGAITVPDISTTDTSVTLNASYTDQGVTVTATKTITLNNQFKVSSISVSGPSSLSINTSYQFNCTATYTDASTASVTPTWSVIGSSAASIDSSGLLTIGQTNVSATITVSASYTERGTTVTANATASLVAISGLASISINGPTNIISGTTDSYTCVATYSDNTTAVVVPTWSLTNNTSSLTIDAAGNLIVPSDLTSGATVTLNASYTENSVTATATLPVTVGISTLNVVDIYYNNTALLLQGNGTSIADDIGNSVSNVNSVVLSNTQTKFNTKSLYFPATAYLDVTLPQPIGANDFTFETWAYYTANPNSGVTDMLIDMRPGSEGSYLAVGIQTNGVVKIYISTTGVVTSSAGAMPLNSWAHIAVARLNGTITLYINGVSVGSASNSTNLLLTNARIGDQQWSGVTSNTPKYLDDVRLTYGVARYTKNFALNTARLANSSDNDYNTLFYASNDLVDINGNLINIVGSAANAYLSSTKVKTGSASFYVNGTASTGFKGYYTGVGSDKFTLEFWVYPTALTNASLIDTRSPDTANLGFSVELNTSGNILVKTNGTTYGTSSNTITANSWHHVAVVKDSSSTAKVYVDGVGTSLSNASSYSFFNTQLNIGTGVAGSMTGYIDSILITKAVKYTANFTPTATEFVLNRSDNFDPFISKTVLLAHFDGVPATTPVDNTGISTLSLVGSAALKNTTLPSFTGNTAALALPSTTGDKVTLPYSSVFDFGTGDLTVEFWMYPTAYNANGKLWFTRCFSGNAFFAIGQTSGGLINLNINNVAKGNGTVAIQLNSWNHIAVVRLGNTWNTYVNGLLDKTFTDTTNLTNANTTALGVGDYTHQSLSNQNTGYVSEFRITKAARYTRNFVPPLRKLPDVTTYEIYNDNVVLNLTADKYEATGKNLQTVGLVSYSDDLLKGPYGSGCVYFNGTNNYIAMPANSVSNLNIGTGNFTVEGWFCPFSYGGAGVNLFSCGISGSDAMWQLAVSTAGDLAILTGVGAWASGWSTNWTLNGVKLPLYKWTHVAITRSSGTVNVYLNGMLAYSNTGFTFPNTTTNDTFYIGQYMGANANFYKGLMCDIRISKTIRYSGEFTPPTSLLPDNATADASWSTVGVLMHLDEQHRLLELSGKGVTAYPTNNPPIVMINSGKFGSGASYFDGATSLSIPNPVDLYFGYGDFTVELWLYPESSNTAANQVLVQSEQYSTATGFCVYIPLAGSSIQVGVGSVGINYPCNLLANSGHHLVVTRKNGYVFSYLNGSFLIPGSTNNASTINLSTAANAYIGSGAATTYFTGWLSDVRITKGVHRYVSTSQIPYTKLTTDGSDPYWSNVICQIPGNGGYTYSDEVTGKSISKYRYADTTQDPSYIAISKFGSSAIYFNGSNFLNYPTDSTNPWDLSNGDFTVEFFIYPTVAPTATVTHLIGNACATGSGEGPGFGVNIPAGWCLRLTSTTLDLVGNNAVQLTSTTSWTINTWYHICLMRKDNSLYLYKDGSLLVMGTRYGSSTTPVILFDNMDSLFIGGNPFYSSTYYYTGIIDELRITKGVARYLAGVDCAFPLTTDLPTSQTLTFTPDTSTTTSKLLLKGNGLNGSQLFADEAGHTVNIVTSTPGYPQVSTSQKNKGTGSIYFDGTSYLSIPVSTDFNLTSGNWTIECWIYYTSTPSANQAIISKDGVGSSAYPQYSIGINSSNKFIAYIGSGNGVSSLQSITGNITLSLNTWNHVAFVKNGVTLNTFVNGVIDISVVQTGTMIDGGKALNIGYEPNQPTSLHFLGYLDDLRITKGIALYVSNFTPPAQELSLDITPISSTLDLWNATVLQLKGNGTNNSTTFTDDAGRTVTANGAAKISTTQFKSGSSSIYLDGTTNTWLNVTSNTATQLGYGDFTIEFSFYTSTAFTTTRTGTIFDFRSGSATNDGMWIGLGNTATNSINVYSNGANQLTGTYSVNTWTHVAVVRSNGVLTLFVNGIKVSTSGAFAFNLSQTITRIGQDFNNTSTAIYLGYLDDLRITKGIARYINSSFQVPQVEFKSGSYDPYYNQITYGAHFNTTTFSDVKGHALTITGKPTLSQISPNFKYDTKGSIYFDGASCISTKHTDLIAGYGDWTIECWAKFNTGVTDATLFTYGPGTSSTNTSFWVRYQSSLLTFVLFTSSTGIALATVSTSILTTDWNHIAVVKYRDKIHCLVNGIRIGVISHVNVNTTFWSPSTTDGTLLFGCYSTSLPASVFNGWMSDIRFTKGIARYLNVIEAESNHDNLLSNTLQLDIHNAGVTDAIGHTVTNNGSVVTADNLYLDQATYFDGSTSYLTIPYTALLDVTQTDFTVEAWVYPFDVSALRTIFGASAGSTGWWFGITAAGKFSFYRTSRNATTYSTTTIPINTWTHVAACISGNSLKLYVNGVLEATATTYGVGNLGSTTTLYIGCDTTLTTKYPGLLRGLRITNGITRYAANFTPPTTPYATGSNDSFDSNVVLNII